MPKLKKKCHARKMLSAIKTELLNTGHDSIKVEAIPRENSISFNSLVKFYMSLGLQVINYHGGK